MAFLLKKEEEMAIILERCCFKEINALSNENIQNGISMENMISQIRNASGFVQFDQNERSYSEFFIGKLS